MAENIYNDEELDTPASDLEWSLKNSLSFLDLFLVSTCLCLESRWKCLEETDFRSFDFLYISLNIFLNKDCL